MDSISKLQNIGHQITLHIADPFIPLNTTWSGYDISPTPGYISPPSPYTEPDNNPQFTTDNIRKSTGFDGVEFGTISEFIRVPLDGADENVPSTFAGGGFVITNANGLTVGFMINKDTRTVDVDVTAMVKWYIQNLGGNQNNRMKILAKGSYVKPTSLDVETPYGYIFANTPIESGLRPSESYMITQPVGDVDEINEVVTTIGRKAKVEFYSFGETADQYNAFFGSYVNGNLVTQINYTKAGGANVVLSVDNINQQGTITIPLTDPTASTFWTRLKPSIASTDTFSVTMTVQMADGNPAGSPTGSLTISAISENSNTATISFIDYSAASSFVGGGSEILSNLSFTVTRTNRSFFTIGSLGNPTAVTSGGIFTNHYPTVNEGSFLYFPQGITLTSAGAGFSINGSGTKRFKVIRSLPSPVPGRHILEVQPWSNFSSRPSVNNNVVISTGLYRPKMIVSYNS